MSDNTDNTDRRTYYLRIVCMYMELTKDILLRLFKHLIKSENITEFLIDLDIKGKLRDLFKDDILNKSEYNLVSSSWPDPEKFDIALLIRLILGLCRDRITQPQLGWHSKLKPKDKSLGADLLRLRDVRNKLIAHSPCAALEKEEYIRIRDKMDAILSRVVAAFDKEANVKKKLKEYEDLHFETENEKIRRYLAHLEISNQETKALQCRVEELLKKSKEFNTYFKTTPERYVRYIKLLFDGGKIVLGGILERELQDQNRTLVSLISENRDMLSCSIGNEYHLFLFPQQNEEIDYKCWEVGLLASVILLLFTHLSLDDISDIENIQTARQDYAKHAVSCLDADEFLDIWTDLIKSLTQLSMGIEKEKKNDVEALIIRFKKTCSELDADIYLHQLRASGVPVKTLKGVYDETMYQLKQKLRRLKVSELPFQFKHLFEVKIMVSCEDEEKKRSAEDFLERNLKASLNKTNDHDNFLKMETDMFMASITSHPDIEPVGIKRCCILLSFQCSTLDGVLSFIDYFHDQHFQERITNISDELSYLFEEPFLLQGYITLESLLSIQTEGCRENNVGEGISIPVESSSMEGIESFLDALHSDETSNALKSIADKISDKVQETVSIYVSADLDGFKDMFDKKETVTKKQRGHIRGVKSLATYPAIESDRYERSMTKKDLSHDILYQVRKQELKWYLIQTNRKTFMERLYGYISPLLKFLGGDFWSIIPIVLRSPETGVFHSERNVFYKFGRLQKNIYVIGDENRVSVACRDLSSTWCDAESIRKIQGLRDFEFVFMLSLSVFGSEVSVYNMIQKQLPSEEYAETLRQVLHHEPEKCLVILDGLGRWERNVNKSGDDFETPDRTLFKDSVVIMTADYRLRKFIEKTFSGDQLLYTN